MLGNLKEKLVRTRQAFRERLENLFLSGQPRDKILEELTEALLLADTGIAATERIIQTVREKTRKDDAYPAIQQALSDELAGVLGRYPSVLAVDHAPAVIMVVGVNGGGKTTSLAKLALHFQTRKKKVLMVAADTFRAAAQEQLAIWGNGWASRSSAGNTGRTQRRLCMTPSSPLRRAATTFFSSTPPDASIPTPT